MGREVVTGFVVEPQWFEKEFYFNSSLDGS